MFKLCTKFERNRIIHLAGVASGGLKLQCIRNYDVVYLFSGVIQVSHLFNSHDLLQKQFEGMNSSGPRLFANEKCADRRMY